MLIKSSKHETAEAQASKSQAKSNLFSRIVERVPGINTFGRLSRAGPSLMTFKCFVEKLVKMSTSAEDIHNEMVKRARTDPKISYHRWCSKGVRWGWTGRVG